MCLVVQRDGADIDACALSPLSDFGNAVLSSAPWFQRRMPSFQLTTISYLTMSMPHKDDGSELTKQQERKDHLHSVLQSDIDQKIHDLVLFSLPLCIIEMRLRLKTSKESSLLSNL